MGIRNAPRVTEPQPVDEIRRQVAALTDASTRRHRIERGTAEYAAALETEERLADRVLRLGASLGSIRQPRPEEEGPKNPRT
jgi:hypothetical protein